MRDILEMAPALTPQEEELKALRTETKRLKAIIGALMCDFSSICEANLISGEVKFMQLVEPFQKAMSAPNLPLWEGLVNMYTSTAIFGEDRAKVQQFLERKRLHKELRIGDNVSLEYRNRYGIYGETKIVRIDEESVLVGFTEKNLEITARKNEIYSDALTMVKNRRFFDEQLASEPCRALVMSDIDRFKAINDNFGHLCGDTALKEVAATLRLCVREGDDVVRFGGDEFLIFFRGISQNALQTRIEKIRQAITNIQLEKYPDLRLSMSFGAVFGKGRAKDMLPEADKLLYESKKTRNTITIRAFEDFPSK